MVTPSMATDPAACRLLGCPVGVSPGCRPGAWHIRRYPLVLMARRASQCLGWGSRPARTFPAAVVDIPVALAMAGKLTVANPGITDAMNHSGSNFSPL